MNNKQHSKIFEMQNIVQNESNYKNYRRYFEPITPKSKKAYYSEKFNFKMMPKQPSEL